jgi:hypothetical protein
MTKTHLSKKIFEFFYLTYDNHNSSHVKSQSVEGEKRRLILSNLARLVDSLNL